MNLLQSYLPLPTFELHNSFQDVVAGLISQDIGAVQLLLLELYYEDDVGKMAVPPSIFFWISIWKHKLFKKAKKQGEIVLR